jgi:multiple sugar transport system substrate-binding protein/sn-glycerol 3-phosphate transport system substrate-binding protein
MTLPHRFRVLVCCTSALLAVLALGGCGGSAPAPGAGFAPIDATQAVFWDRQTTETAALLRSLVAEFNAGREGIPVAVERAGGYSEIFRKVSASIQARRLPAMAVSYESMTAEYAASGAVAPLDALVQDPATGFSPAELEDFFPAVLASNRFEQFGGQLYSFPFAKSVLMLYYNKRVLAAAGIAAPPETWVEFVDQCRKIKAATGKQAHAVSVDCSTVNGLIFSMGGEVLGPEGTLYDRPEAVAVFELYETLAKEGLAFQITPGTFDDEVALVNDQVAFTLRTSSGRASMARNMGDAADRWGWKRIPQADPAQPATVLFGPNVTLFSTTPEQQQTAWAFVKYFTSPDVGARWAAETGYLPVRKSAVNHPVLQEFWKKWEGGRAAYDCLAFAKVEPNVMGWQEVRTLVERALTEVLSGLKPGRQAATELKLAADAALKRHTGAGR